MAAPGKKFSFNRLITNAFPNFANDSANDVDLTPQQADKIVEYQLGTAHPRYLSEQAISLANVTDSESVSKKVHSALIKHGIITATPEASASEEPITVNTAGIGKGFASQLAIISVHAQRKLVGLLFFWEEECTRWKLLDEEEREIREALKQNEGSADLHKALEAVQMKKSLVPSKRGEATANVGEGAGHELPSYN